MGHGILWQYVSIWYLWRGEFQGGGEHRLFFSVCYHSWMKVVKKTFVEVHLKLECYKHRSPLENIEMSTCFGQ